MDRILKSSRVVDTESLCIIPGEQVWSLRVDVHILNHDGNLADAVVAAALAALLDFRRPDVSITEDGFKIVLIRLSPQLPNSSLSIAYFV